MMKQEFENLLGYIVSSEQYDKVEKVYMAIQKMSKQKIVDLYKHDEFFVTDTFYSHVMEIENKQLTKQFEFMRKLAIKYSNEMDRFESENEVLQNDNENLMSDLQDYETENAKLIAENEVLQNKITSLENRCKIFEKAACDYSTEIDRLEAENDELKTQLHQYQSLFSDIERNMTVSLYESLLGMAN